MQVKIINKSNNPLPQYETQLAAGIDIRAFLENDEILAPLERKLIKTGLFLEIPDGFEAQVRPRSGLALKSGITVLNSPGTIDADYRGEIGVILCNVSNENFNIQSGDRIAQLVFATVVQADFSEINILSETERGSGGFGSTGIK